MWLVVLNYVYLTFFNKPDFVKINHNRKERTSFHNRSFHSDDEGLWNGISYLSWSLWWYNLIYTIVLFNIQNFFLVVAKEWSLYSSTSSFSKSLFTYFLWIKIKGIASWNFFYCFIILAFVITIIIIKM